MITKHRTFLLGALAAVCSAVAAGAAPEKSASAPVERTVKARSGVALRWQQSAAAREEALGEVHRLLQKPLTVSAAVQIAVLNNRELLATLEEVGISAADLREAGLWKNPSIDLSVRFPDRAPRVPNWEEGAAFDLLDLLMIPLRKRAAADRLEAAQLRVADEVVKLVADVKAAAFQLMGDRMQAEQQKALMAIESAALDLAQRQHEAGNITDLALAQQQAAYNTRRMTQANMEAMQGEHREKLNRLLSLWGRDTSWTISADLPALPEKDLPVRGLESLAVAQRLDLAAAQKELAGVVRALGLTKTYRYIGALSFGVDTERDPDRTNVTGPRLSLELPLFNQGQARIAKGEAELRRAERQVEALAIGIRADVRALQAKLAALRDATSFQQVEVIPNRKAIWEGAYLRYNGMLLGNFELFNTRAELVDAEAQGIEALRDYWMTRAELERAVGGNLNPAARTRTASSK